MRYAAIAAGVGEFSIALMCRVLEVAPSGYYAWRKRPLSERAKRDQVLMAHVRGAFRASRGRNGSPRVHAELQAEYRVGRKRVARLMRTDGLRARARRRYVVTTQSRHEHPIAPNLLARQFEVTSLLTYALTVLFGRSLEEVLREAVMTPIGASESWSWHGYTSSSVAIDGASIPVVSGGAHWGGGLFISAADFALIGQLYLDGGRRDGRQVISTEWIDRSWSPCDVKPEYGYLWWLNDDRRPWPTAPATGRGARGNGGRHLLWIDPARDLVLTARWTECVHRLLAEVSAAITPAGG